MKTDVGLYKIFSVKPDLFEKITGYDSKGMTFESINLKEVSRQLDGVLRPVDRSKPQIVIEFQGYYFKKVYQRIILEMMQLDIQDDRETHGIVVFLRREFDPKTKTWHKLAKSSDPTLEHVYLIEELRRVFGEDLQKLAVANAELAVFTPLLYDDDESLKRVAAKAYHLLEQADINEEEKEVLQSVLYQWLSERFTDMTSEEQNAMIELRTPFEETRAYKDIIQKAKPDIIEEAKPVIIEEAKPVINLEFLQKLLADGSISQDAYDKHAANLNGKNHTA